MRPSITFIHAADLHLDSPFKGLMDVPEEIFQSVRNSTFAAFDRLIDVAIEKQVDFVLIVGDLFDHERQSLKAQLHLRDGFERLHNEGINVYLSYGNHDYTSGNPYPIEYPQNVFVFPNEEISSFIYEKAGQKLAQIYGFSYEKRAVTEKKAVQYKVTNHEIPFHIAMLHGMIHGASEHDPYAPFRLEDLRNEPFDYWALGHVHKRQILQETPPVVYSGNIQGRHRNETGEKGCYFVQLDESEVNLQFIPLQVFTIVHEKFDLTQYTNITEIIDALMHLLDKNGQKPHLYAFDFYSNNQHNESIGLHERLDELIEIVNESYQSLHVWQFIYTYQLKMKDMEERTIDTLFIKEISEALQSINVAEEIDDLFNHKHARSYLTVDSDEKLLEEAYELLLNELQKKVR